MTYILAVDPNTADRRVGWALMSRSEILDYGHGIGYAISSLESHGVSNMTRMTGEITTIVCEGQYVPRGAKNNRIQSILTLARSAGRWMQIAADHDLDCVYIEPGDWMISVLGRWMTDGKARQRYIDQAIQCRYGKVGDIDEHVKDAICLGISWLEKTYARSSHQDALGSTKSFSKRAYTRWTKKSNVRRGR